MPALVQQSEHRRRYGGNWRATPSKREPRVSRVGDAASRGIPPFHCPTAMYRLRQKRTTPKKQTTLWSEKQSVRTLRNRGMQEHLIESFHCIVPPSTLFSSECVPMFETKKLGRCGVRPRTCVAFHSDALFLKRTLGPQAATARLKKKKKKKRNEERQLDKSHDGRFAEPEALCNRMRVCMNGARNV